MASFTERLYLTDGLTLETRDGEHPMVKVGNAILGEHDVEVLIKALQHWLKTGKLKYE
jgi:hypothetical protein